jgi:uncharacterized protein YndB with AHSA1/START domain
MARPAEAITSSDRELVLSRVLPATRDQIYKAWSTPALIRQWWCPRPWSTPHCEIDLATGGVFKTTMRGPDGEEVQTAGVFLEVVPRSRIVFTDAFTKPWVPSEKPFMTADLTLVDEGGKTRYTARVFHWSAEDREKHENMGFYEGWGIVMDQLAEVATRL